MWPVVGDLEADPNQYLNAKIHIPFSCSRFCQSFSRRILEFALFACYGLSELVWARVLTHFVAQDPSCLADPNHRSWPGCYKLSVPPNSHGDQDPQSEQFSANLELVMDSVQELSLIGEEYLQYRQLVSLALVCLLLLTCGHMVCVKSIGLFVLMLKIAVAPSVVFLTFFFFVFCGFVIVVHLLLGDSLEAFSSFQSSLLTTATVLAGEFDFLQSADELTDMNNMIAQVWFWAFMIIGVFILLNVFITILGEAYDAAKDIPVTRSMLSYYPLVLTPIMPYKLRDAIFALNQLIINGQIDGTDCVVATGQPNQCPQVLLNRCAAALLLRVGYAPQFAQISMVSQDNDAESIRLLGCKVLGRVCDSTLDPRAGRRRRRRRWRRWRRRRRWWRERRGWHCDAAAGDARHERGVSARDGPRQVLPERAAGVTAFVLSFSIMND